MRAVILLVNATFACNDGPQRVYVFRQEVYIMQMVHLGFEYQRYSYYSYFLLNSVLLFFKEIQSN